MGRGIHGWSRDEVVSLRRLAETALAPQEIAARLGRPLDEVERKAASEDIPLHRPALKSTTKLAEF
jgi:hypothetical protein